MELLILASRFLLAGVMGIAGVAKLADIPGSRQAVQDFGIPAPLASALGRILPVAELAAALLLLTPWAWWGAFTSLILLLAFIGGISYNLRQGKTPDCHCFGQLHAKPIGWPTLARNGGLAIVALWLLRQGPSRFSSHEATLWISIIAVLLALAEGWWIVKQRQHLQAFEAQGGTTPPIPTTATAPPGLYIGSPAPPFHLAGLDGTTTTLDSLLAAQKPLFLIFIDPTCASCNALLPEIEQWQQEHGNKLTIVPISRGNVESNRTSKAGLQNLLLQEKAEVSTAYHVERMPSAVVIHPNGTIGSAIAGGADTIRTQIAHITQPILEDNFINEREREINQGDDYCKNGVDNSMALHPIAQRGDVAPDFTLPDLEGEMLGLDPLRGHQLLLLFWNPSCSDCRQMLTEIKAIEEDRPPNAPQLLLITGGTAEANRGQELRSPILLDTEMAVTRRYGAIGTPSALLIDANGRIASDLALGRKAVLALLAATFT